MKQVVQNMRTGRLSVVEVPAPRVQAHQLLVRTQASLISAGTERMIVDFANKTLVGKARSRPDLVRKVIDKTRRDGILTTLRTVLARLDEPLPLGYSAAGVVVEVGRELEGRYRVGQRVAIAGAGVANHAEVNAVAAALTAPIPDDVSFEEAAFGTVSAIALHGARNLQTSLGDCVAVIGAGLVGLLAIQLLSLGGVRVVALDVDPGRLSLAASLGAEWVFDLREGGAANRVMAATRGRGVDGLLIAAATDTNEPLILAADIARDRARVSLVGKIGTEFPFAEFMKKELSLVVSRSYGPGRYDDDFEQGRVVYPPGFVRWTETENLAECLRLMSARHPRRLSVRELITHRYTIADAEKAYELVLNGVESHLGVVLEYPEPAPAQASVAHISPPAQRGGGQCNLGVIGAGAFANAVLLPILTKTEGAHLRSVATSRGMTADHARQRHGFVNAAADPAAVLDDAAVDAIVVLTRSQQHAALVVRALAAGKAVFVEKPLARTRSELADVARAREQADRFFTVGFNRRFAPLSIQARETLRGLPGPRVILIRVNAGPSEAVDRILEEMCHFVDLARCFAGHPIRSVQATAATRPGAGSCDDVTATIAFSDGSIATIVYTGLGDASYAKEMIEIFAAGTVIRIDDFRGISIVRDGRTIVQRSRLQQDKGHQAEMAAFVTAVRGSAGPPIDEAELLETSLATIAVLESLQSGARVDL